MLKYNFILDYIVLKAQNNASMLILFIIPAAERGENMQPLDVDETTDTGTTDPNCKCNSSIVYVISHKQNRGYINSRIHKDLRG